MARIATETGKVRIIRAEVRNARIDHALRVVHEFGEAWARNVRMWNLEDEAQALLNQVSNPSTPKGGLRLGPSIKLIRNLDGGFHAAAPYFPQTHIYGIAAKMQSVRLR
jgi:hypothetical protein